MADYDKTNSQIDEWAVIAAAAMREGAVFTFADHLKDGVIVTLVKGEAVAHDGEGYVILECSRNASGNEDWTEIAKFQTNAETAATTTLDAEAAAAATTVPLTATANFATKGDRYLISNGTIANSEVVRNNGYSDGVSITILDGLTNTQQNGVSIFTTVEQYAFTDIPEIFQRGRVLILNNDADCDLISRTEFASVTDLV